MKKALILFLATACLLLCACGLLTPPKASPTPSPSPSPTPARGETITTAPPSAAPTTMPEPQPTAEATAVPIPEATTEPAETPAPTSDPGKYGREIASGTFRSDTGTYLNLVADWSAVTVNDNSFKLTIILSLESYSLDVGERRGNTLTVNGKEYSFITDPIEIDQGFTKTKLYVWSQELPTSQLDFDLKAVWYMRGSYSGQELETVELSGSYTHHG